MKEYFAAHKESFKRFGYALIALAVVSGAAIYYLN